MYRAGPHMGVGWQTFVAYTLCHWLFLTHIFWMGNRICCWHSFSVHSAATSWIWHVAHTPQDSNSNWIPIWIEQLVSVFKSKPFTRKRFALRDLKTLIQHRTFFFCFFFWETKHLCARGESFCVHKGTEDGVDERRKVSGTINIALSGKVESRPLS